MHTHRSYIHWFNKLKRVKSHLYFFNIYFFDYQFLVFYFGSLVRIYFFPQVVEMSALCFLQTKLNVKSVHFIRISVRPVTSKMYYILLATCLCCSLLLRYAHQKSRRSASRHYKKEEAFVSLP